MWSGAVWGEGCNSPMDVRTHGLTSNKNTQDTCFQFSSFHFGLKPFWSQGYVPRIWHKIIFGHNRRAFPELPWTTWCHPLCRLQSCCWPFSWSSQDQVNQETRHRPSCHHRKKSTICCRDSTEHRTHWNHDLQILNGISLPVDKIYHCSQKVSITHKREARRALKHVDGRE